MKSDLQKGLLFITAGIMGLLLIPNLFGSSRGFSMMGRMGMMNRMGSGMMEGMMQNMNNIGEIDKKTDFSSNGERIFYRGINSKGEAIRNTHGMQGVGCAMCHGADARGSKMMMMEVPDIRWSTLTNPEAIVHSSNRKHPPYTEETFKTTLFAGVDPGGNQLSTMMPKWEISKGDIDDLISYLKTK